MAKKIQNKDMQNGDNLRDLIKEISGIAGKNISKEKEDKIVGVIKNNKVPNDLSKMIK